MGGGQENLGRESTREARWETFTLCLRYSTDAAAHRQRDASPKKREEDRPPAKVILDVVA